jgi:hypothetical protein
MTSRVIGRGPRRQRLVHAAMDAYLAWRDECAAVSDAFRRWADAARSDAALAWRKYEVALDREEEASVLYADLVRRLGDLDARDRTPGTDLAASGDALR